MVIDCDIAVIGAGMAAGRLLNRLAEADYAGSVAVISKEAHAGYNRILLPDYLAGQCSIEQMEPWPEVGGVLPQKLRRFDRCEVRAVDLAQKSAELSSGEHIRWRTLVFANGATVPGAGATDQQRDNVQTLRSIADCDALRQTLSPKTRIVVVGGGLLGLEAASALHSQCAQVHVIHRNPLLMNRQLDRESSELLLGALQAMGIDFSLGRTIKALVGESRVDEIRLDDGSCLPCDRLVLATGTRADDSLARRAGLACDGGICVDATLRTSHPDVYALGECAAQEGVQYALVAPIYQQADALAGTLLGGKPQTARIDAPFTRLKVKALSLISMGDIAAMGKEGVEDYIVRDHSEGVYRRLVFDGARLIAAVLWGSTRASGAIAQRLGSEVALSDRDRLLFGTI